MEKDNTKRIDDLKKELEKCKKAPWNSLSLLAGILGACAIGYYVFYDVHLAFLIGGLIGLSGFYFWAKLRRVYKELVKVYEAELDA